MRDARGDSLSHRPSRQGPGRAHGPRRPRGVVALFNSRSRRGTVAAGGAEAATTAEGRHLSAAPLPPFLSLGGAPLCVSTPCAAPALHLPQGRRVAAPRPHAPAPRHAVPPAISPSTCSANAGARCSGRAWPPHSCGVAQTAGLGKSRARRKDGRVDEVGRHPAHQPLRRASFPAAQCHRPTCIQDIYTHNHAAPFPVICIPCSTALDAPRA